MVSMLFGGAVTLIFLALPRHSDEEREILLSYKSYGDGGPEATQIIILGTLTGEGVFYKNNSHGILCEKERRARALAGPGRQDGSRRQARQRASADTVRT
jgi:hypothetical protein